MIKNIQSSSSQRIMKKKNLDKQSHEFQNRSTYIDIEQPEEDKNEEKWIFTRENKGILPERHGECSYQTNIANEKKRN